MKRYKTWYWLGATLLYSALFYDQSAGVNFLIFNVALVGTVFGLQPKLRAQRAVKAIAAGCLLTAVAIVWHPTWPAILMNIVSLMGLSGLSYQPKGSLIVGLVNSGYSLVATAFRQTFGRLTNVPTPGKPSTTVTAGITADKLVSRGAPVLIVALFFVLYTQASPAFSALFANISLDFISGWWMMFTLFGAYLLLSFFYPSTIRSLSNADLNTPDELVRRRRKTITGFNPVGLRYEYRSGWMLFVMLNALLFFFNAVDMFYVVSMQLPEGVTYTAFVHQGVYTLIASVILAIIIVMFFFRGNLNFLKNNRRLKQMAYVWTAQNAVLILTTAAKTSGYVAAYGLTHKRIGVYVYLLLTLIGLVTTYLKVRDVKTNWFLFRRNAWYFYAVLVVFSWVDWTRVITQFNLAHYDQGKLGMHYLVDLPYSNLDLLVEAQNTHPLELDSYSRDQITQSLDRFKRREQREGWLSWNHTDYMIGQRLQRVR